MTITLELEQEQETRLKRRAERYGLSVQDYLLQLDEQMDREPITDLETWKREFLAASTRMGPAPATPPLSELTREAFYEEEE